ncbi:MAG: GGDEF domain-containing protein [Sulfurospirillaceae bacterium]|nr:GGDEF domain-containing protein [Sulfurospirillaceae bacterium]MDD2825888.1 GGDEF domain-containing protein [Sulfurospirillaceae bacterium]
MNKKLQELTDETIKEIRKLEIVLPEIYQDIFYTKAKELNVTMSESDKEMAMIYALKKIQNLKDETEKSASILKENVSNAKTAIANKDNVALNIIENNMIDLEKKISMLQQELFIDELTHLYNRRWLFEKFLNDDLFKEDGVLAFIDLNNFKYVNDTYGHIVGDKVLNVLGKVLKRIEDSIAIRFAGDEFIVVSQHHNEAELMKLLNTVNHNLRLTNLKHGEQVFHVDFAFGVVTFSKDDIFKTILELSDERMYHHKKSAK